MWHLAMKKKVTDKYINKYMAVPVNRKSKNKYNFVKILISSGEYYQYDRKHH